MPRFLHTGDLHLNALRRDFPHYLVRAQWVLDAIEATADEYECDCIVIAGDIFEQPNLTIAERQLVSNWLGKLARPALIVSGNHDSRNKNNIGDTCLSYLSALNLHLHLVHDGDPKMVNAFGAWWLLLPHHGWTDQEFRLIVESMVWRIRRKDKDTPIVAVVHEAVYGCQTDTGFEVPGAVIKLSEKIGVTYWALADIHLCQSMLPNAWYSGSPYQTNFGEDLDKGILIVDTDNPTEPGFVDLECPYTLHAMDETPDEWPMFGKFKSEIPEGVKLPDHIVWEPPTRNYTDSDVGEALVPLLHGLEQKLVVLQHPDDLIETTLEMADRLVEEVGIGQ